ncbi:MAG: WD40/YVTN/BNR-like repeat-containing protein [Thermoanaerobaculia bacterium]
MFRRPRTIVVSLALSFLGGVAEGQWRRAGLDGTIVTALAVDPSNASTIYAGTSQAGLWKSVNGGATWSASGSGYTGDIVTALLIDPSSPNVLYVGSNVGVFKSINAGATWNLKVAGLSDNRVQALALDPSSPNVLYVSVLGPNGGIHRSANGAEVWTPRALPVPSGAAAALAVRGGDVYAGWANVLFRSQNAGSSWTIPFPDVLTGSIAAIAAPSGETDVVVGLSQRGIYRTVSTPSPDWVRAAGLTSLRIAVLAVRPGDQQTIFAGGSGGGVFRSSDGGRSWTRVSTGLSNTDVAALAFDSSGGRLYAATADGVFVLDLAQCGSPSALCLTAARFRVEVAWRVASQGRTGVGTAVPIADDTGAFWFFDSANLELMIKVLDARPINGRFWVFFGALSDIEYTVTVTDLVTGAVKRYDNPQGRLASVADTSAF